MTELQKSTLPDHEEQFAATFENINALIEEERLDQALAILSDLHYADLADFIDNTGSKVHKQILPPLSDKIKPDTFAHLSHSSKLSMIDILGVDRISQMFEELDLEDAIESIDNLDEELSSNILNKLSTEKRQQILEGFTFPEDTVGRIVEKNFVTFQQHWTVGQAIDNVRHKHPTNDFHAAIIVDSKNKPVGNILLSTLLKNPRTAPLKEIMNSDLKVVDLFTDLSEISFIFKQYALTIVPVVNKSGKLVGSVSIDSMLYIIEQQAEKDIMQLGGVNSQDIFDKIFYMTKHRFPWLFVNLITACLTAIIINQFSDTISKLVTLAAIMPVVASMGGNAGTQAMTVTVRALANKDINQTNMFRVIGKEIISCSINGIFLAIIGGILSYIILSDIDLSIVFGFAVVINFIVAGFFGSAIPIALYNIDVDPATSSGVLLTALTDSFGFFTFLTLAYLFLV